MIVVDTSVIASLWVPNDMDELAYKVLKKDAEWVAPLLWRSEFRNVLALYLRKNIITLNLALQSMQEAEELMKNKEYSVDSVQVFQFINHSKCSAYDCEFIALAHELDLPLVTFDKKLKSEFPDIAVSPQSFIQ